MPATRDIKLSKDWRGRKAGDVVTVTNEQYVEALHEQVVRKTYLDPVPGVKKHRLGGTAKRPAAKRAAKKTTARKTAAKKSPTAPSGDEK